MTKVSILMLVHNAPQYLLESIETLRTVTDNQVPYELIVLDNASDEMTLDLLKELQEIGAIDKLLLNDENSLFAKGNNLASEFVSDDATHYLLLNSDVSIKSSDWLKELTEIHLSDEKIGITSYGAVSSAPVRADGWCMLINRNLYDEFKLDENFEWFWGVTKLQVEVLKAGYRVLAVADGYDKYIVHYGGKSGYSFFNAKGMNTDIKEIIAWFDGVGCVEIIKV